MTTGDGLQGSARLRGCFVSGKPDRRAAGSNRVAHSLQLTSADAVPATRTCTAFPTL